MKFGLRKPSLTKILRAKTTGRATRLIKSVSPLYGRKPLGLIKNPRRSFYNLTYRKTSFSIVDWLKNLFNLGGD